MSEFKEPYEKEEFLYELTKRVIVTVPTLETQMVFSRNICGGYDVQLNLYEGTEMVFMGDDKHYESFDDVYELYLTTIRMMNSL